MSRTKGSSRGVHPRKRSVSALPSLGRGSGSNGVISLDLSAVPSPRPENIFLRTREKSLSPHSPAVGTPRSVSTPRSGDGEQSTEPTKNKRSHRRKPSRSKKSSRSRLGVTKTSRRKSSQRTTSPSPRSTSSGEEGNLSPKQLSPILEQKTSKRRSSSRVEEARQDEKGLTKRSSFANRIAVHNRHIKKQCDYLFVQIRTYHNHDKALELYQNVKKYMIENELIELEGDQDPFYPKFRKYIQDLNTTLNGNRMNKFELALVDYALDATAWKASIHKMTQCLYELADSLYPEFSLAVCLEKSRALTEEVVRIARIAMNAKESEPLSRDDICACLEYLSLRVKMGYGKAGEKRLRRLYEQLNFAFYTFSNLTQDPSLANRFVDAKLGLQGVLGGEYEVGSVQLENWSEALNVESRLMEEMKFLCDNEKFIGKNKPQQYSGTVTLQRACRLWLRYGGNNKATKNFKAPIRFLNNLLMLLDSISEDYKKIAPNHKTDKTLTPRQHQDHETKRAEIMQCYFDCMSMLHHNRELIQHLASKMGVIETNANTHSSNVGLDARYQQLKKSYTNEKFSVYLRELAWYSRDTTIMGMSFNLLPLSFMGLDPLSRMRRGLLNSFVIREQSTLLKNVSKGKEDGVVFEAVEILEKRFKGKLSDADILAFVMCDSSKQMFYDSNLEDVDQLSLRRGVLLVVERVMSALFPGSKKDSKDPRHVMLKDYTDFVLNRYCRAIFWLDSADWVALTQDAPNEKSGLKSTPYSAVRVMETRLLKALEFARSKAEDKKNGLNVFYKKLVCELERRMMFLRVYLHVPTNERMTLADIFKLVMEKFLNVLFHMPYVFRVKSHKKQPPSPSKSLRSIVYDDEELNDLFGALNYFLRGKKSLEAYSKAIREYKKDNGGFVARLKSSIRDGMGLFGRMRSGSFDRSQHITSYGKALEARRSSVDYSSEKTSPFTPVSPSERPAARSFSGDKFDLDAFHTWMKSQKNSSQRFSEQTCSTSSDEQQSRDSSPIEKKGKVDEEDEKSVKPFARIEPVK